MTGHATTIATAVGRLNEGDINGYITTLYHPHSRFHGFPDTSGPTVTASPTSFGPSSWPCPTLGSPLRISLSRASASPCVTS